MPHQSGVTRMWVDRRRDRATDLPGTAVTRSRDDASAVVKELVPGVVVRGAHARKESNLRSSVLETATSP